MKSKPVILAAIAAMVAIPATAQYGRLVPPAKIVALHASACVANAPDFATGLPRLAALRKWDEYGRSAKARPGDRAWLVSIDGQPTIVDISRQGDRQRCSVNAVTAPGGVLEIVKTQQRRKPDAVQRQAAGGDVNTWRISPKRTIAVTVPMGQALGRITLEASR